MNEPELELDTRRKFSIVIHQGDVGGEMKGARGAAYDIRHPEKGRRPLNGNLMLLTLSQEMPMIKVRSMSCPVFITQGSDHANVRRKTGDDLVKELYNTKYVEKLKKDLLQFYHDERPHLEEEVIEEESSDLIKENEYTSQILSGCLSHHNSLSQDTECSDFTDITAKSSISSIHSCNSLPSINNEGKPCHRHHHRRPSCAIKFDKPQILEWSEPDPNDIFKDNYSLS